MNAMTAYFDSALPGFQRPAHGTTRRLPLILWVQRARQRRVLREMEDWQLADIGISREQAEREAAKPFWQA